MSQTSDDYDEDSNGDEATTFNAEAHLQCFSEMLQFYGQDFKEWCVRLIADNANTYLRAAKLAGVPHVGCASHKLNVEVNAVVRRHADLHHTIDAVHEKMKAAKTKLKTQLFRAILPTSSPLCGTKRIGQGSWKYCPHLGRWAMS